MMYFTPPRCGKTAMQEIIKKVNEILKEFYAVIEEYLEYIFNAPSTINRIIKYYAIGFDADNYNKRYIMFGGMIIREYELEVPKIECGIR